MQNTRNTNLRNFRKLLGSTASPVSIILCQIVAFRRLALIAVHSDVLFQVAVRAHQVFVRVVVLPSLVAALVSRMLLPQHPRNRKLVDVVTNSKNEVSLF